MKVFVPIPLNLSTAMVRIASRLKIHLPADQGFTLVGSEAEADVVVLHTIGYPETVEAIDRLEAAGKKAIIAQYCLRTTQQPSTTAWLPLWKKAALVWSYYDLPTLTEGDGNEFEGVNYYHSPLGADPIFHRGYWIANPIENRGTTIVSSGFVAASEGVQACTLAAYRVGGRHFHLGPAIVEGPHVRTAHDISDYRLAAEYGCAQYVAGLRRGEGFELPAAEGLMCGATPVMFDRPHYREWFDEFAVFVNEGSEDDLERDLVNIFRRLPTRLPDDLVVLASERFAWPTIVAGFWKQLREGL